MLSVIGIQVVLRVRERLAVHRVQEVGEGLPRAGGLTAGDGHGRARPDRTPTAPSGQHRVRLRTTVDRGTGQVGVETMFDALPPNVRLAAAYRPPGGRHHSAQSDAPPSIRAGTHAQGPQHQPARLRTRCRFFRVRVGRSWPARDSQPETGQRRTRLRFMMWKNSSWNLTPKSPRFPSPHGARPITPAPG